MNKNELTEIKKGNVGTGLLIENDGYVKMDKSLIKENMEGEWHCPYPFIVDCVLQRADCKNANQRVYPYEILKREIENYQKKIQDHRALGECYTPDAECLTSEGWKKITEVKKGDSVLTLNTVSLKPEYNNISEIVETEWNNELISIKYEGKINDIVTPNHSYPIISTNDGHYSFSGFSTAEELSTLEKKSKYYLILNKESITETKCNIFDITEATFNKVQYQGKVYCIEVPNHTWFVRQNGCEHWTKNCNHPSDSTIDLGRISHNIVECHWEGKTVVGKLELNLSQGFVKQGVCSTYGDTCANLILNGYRIGISSRAVGSVESKYGLMTVGDDLELIAFDLVSDPSTPNAFLGTEEEVQTRFLQLPENKEINSSKNKINEKINKLNKIIL